MSLAWSLIVRIVELQYARRFTRTMAHSAIEMPRSAEGQWLDAPATGQEEICMDKQGLARPC
ncbi:hypothetical protein ACLB1R_00335 [Escherichia coli]